jgi:hypothetical protein
MGLKVDIQKRLVESKRIQIKKLANHYWRQLYYNMSVFIGDQNLVIQIGKKSIKRLPVFIFINTIIHFHLA